MTARPLALIAIVAILGSVVLPGTARAEHPKRDATVAGDLTSQWFHIGGGAGATSKLGANRTTPSARFDLGGGFYTFLLYSGASLNITANRDTPFMLSGVGSVGIALPLPVVHPLIGIKAGGGFHTDTENVGPQLVIGPQVGFIVRKFDGRPGLRFMFDVEATWRPLTSTVTGGGFLTVSGVF
jgi:hypothetical protein